MKFSTPIFLIFHYLVPFTLWAEPETPTSLATCIEIAVTNNSSLKLQQLELKRSAIEHRQAHLNRLPGVNAYVSHGFSKGRSVDPTTNLFTEQSFGYGNQQLSADMTLFNGFQTLHNIRARANALKASTYTYEAALINLKLDVVEAYLQVQTAEQMTEQFEQQVALMKEQLRRSSILHTEGAIPPNDFYDLSGQVKREEQQLEQSKNNSQRMRLRLANLMEIPASDLGPLQLISIPQETSNLVAEEVFGQASEGMPIMKAQAFKIKEATNYYKSAKGNYLPSISIGAGIGGQYSNKVEAPYFDQFQNNLGRSISASLRIPIFNRLQTFNQVKMAKVSVDQATIMQNQQKETVREQTAQKILELEIAREGIRSLEQQLALYEESFRIAQVQFDAGNSNSYLYLAAKNKLDQTQRELLILQNTYILQKYIQDSYMGHLNL